MYRKEKTYSSDLLFLETEVMDPRQLFFYYTLMRQQKNRNRLEKNEHIYNTRKKDSTYLPPFYAQNYRTKITNEYLKGTALYFADSFSAPLNLYNFGILKFIGFLADTETISDTLDLCKGDSVLTRRDI
ncbi:hypothetical protein NQ317_013407 [Molorchus minor]|uniref:Uncharacterized protein n=1 Tax=Molorchus minor TaxID=1323400 RepID=A0ABQ9JA03_9CUCU|nr:hypothetical protein NQ317_013407 [Molorchus minor]